MRSKKNHGTKRKCRICLKAETASGNWCGGCLALCRIIHAALADPDDRGERAAEAFDVQRRRELHARRAAPLRTFLRGWGTDPP